MTEDGARARRVKPFAIAGLVAFGLLQLVPYAWNHQNPQVTATPPWTTAEGEPLARAACYDCHSNETEWPWYSYVAPMSWLVRYDIDRGREALNFSEWGEDQDAGEAAETVEDRSMPPDRYERLHSGARLSDEERQALIAALEALDEGGGDGDNSGPGGGDADGGNSGPGSGGEGSGPGSGGDGSGGDGSGGDGSGGTSGPGGGGAGGG
ncbi:MAG TPA: heme-binding domain-containing protein [Acidimicrobiales bacterium]|nr:heme-binding domain-containing protein [Acidimicrobiales bacterium]